MKCADVFLEKYKPLKKIILVTAWSRGTGGGMAGIYLMGSTGWMVWHSLKLKELVARTAWTLL